MPTFESRQMETQLAELSRPARGAFAIACSLRLAKRAAKPHVLAGKARELAVKLLDAPAVTAAAEALLSELEASPELDRDDVAASFYALASLVRPEPRSAFWAAQRAYEAADTAAQDSMKPLAFSAEVEAALLAHPLVQQELSMQARDLASLVAKPQQLMAVVERARET